VEFTKLIHAGLAHNGNIPRVRFKTHNTRLWMHLTKIGSICAKVSAYFYKCVNFEVTNKLLDGYHYWRPAAASGNNIPKILTHNRIHKTSAFNAKGVSNEPLREWYRSQIDTKYN